MRVLDGLDGFDAFEPLPTGSAAAVGRIADHSRDLRAAERIGIRRMAPARLAAYSSGRRVAREALRGIGIADAAIARRGRMPIWPAGVAGSIAHSRQLALAVAARRTCLAGIGADLERSGRVSAAVAERVLSPAERAQASAGDLRTLLFSAKEAVYKAVSPLAGEFLEFLDVELAIFPDGCFSARSVRGGPSAALAAAGRGRYLAAAGHWITVFSIPSAAVRRSARRVAGR